MRLLLAAGDRALFDVYGLLQSRQAWINGTFERIIAGNWAPGALRANGPGIRQYFREMDDPTCASVPPISSTSPTPAGSPAGGAGGQPPLSRSHHPDGRGSAFPNCWMCRPKLKGLVSGAWAPVPRTLPLLARGGSGGVRRQQPAAGSPGTAARWRWMATMVRVRIQPSSALRREYLKLIAEEAELSRGLQHLRDLPAETLDQHRLELRQFRLVRRYRRRSQQWGAGRGAVSLGAAFLFCAIVSPARKSRPPSTPECCESWNRIRWCCAPWMGGDKAVAVFSIGRAEPVSGLARYPHQPGPADLFKTQLRAMLRAGARSIPIWRSCFR